MRSSSILSLSLCFVESVRTAKPVDQLFKIDAATCNGKPLAAMFREASTLVDFSLINHDRLQKATEWTTTEMRNRMKMPFNSFGTTYLDRDHGPYEEHDQGILSWTSKAYLELEKLLAGDEAGPEGSERLSLSPSTAYVSCSDESYEETTIANDIDPDLPDVLTVNG